MVHLREQAGMNPIKIQAGFELLVAEWDEVGHIGSPRRGAWYCSRTSVTDKAVLLGVIGIDVQLVLSQCSTNKGRVTDDDLLARES